MADRTLSPIDQLYEEIMGDIPKKAGTAYERLATAALIANVNFRITA